MERRKRHTAAAVTATTPRARSDPSSAVFAVHHDFEAGMRHSVDNNNNVSTSFRPSSASQLYANRGKNGNNNNNKSSFKGGSGKSNSRTRMAKFGTLLVFGACLYQLDSLLGWGDHLVMSSEYTSRFLELSMSTTPTQPSLGRRIGGSGNGSGSANNDGQPTMTTREQSPPSTPETSSSSSGHDNNNAGTTSTRESSSTTGGTSPTAPDDAAAVDNTANHGQSSFVPELPAPVPPKWGRDRPDTLTVTTGSSSNQDNDDNAKTVVVLLTDARAGGDALLRTLADDPCPDMPPSNLGPAEMPWFPLEAQQCTYAYWANQLLVKEESPCRTTAAVENDVDDPRCPMIREIIERYPNNESAQKEELMKRYLAAFTSHDTTLIPCQATCRPDAVKYIKVVSDWGLPLAALFPAANNSGQGVHFKSIRLTRRNLFERYMAFVLATKTNMWSINSPDDKVKQVAAFNDFMLNMGEMISFFEKFLREDTAADAAVRERFPSTLWIDHADARDRPDVVKSAIRTYVQSGTMIDAAANAADVGIIDNGWPRGREFLQKLSNKDIVGEMLGTAGRADWIGRSSPRTIRLFLVDAINQRPYDLPPGVQATRVPTVELLKAHAGLLAADDWVVVADYHTTVNPHIRTNSHWYGALARFRSRLEQHGGNGKVVVASAAAEPTSDVAAASRKLAAREGLTLAGPAAAVLKILNGDAAGVEMVADDRSMFGWGLRFEGVMDKMGCDNTGSHTISVVSDQPLFVSNTQTNCFRPPVTFPLWGEHNNEHIRTEPIVEHINRILTKNESLTYIDRHFGNEIVYHVNATGLFGGPVVRDQFRVLPTEDLLVKAHDILMEEQKTGRTTKWPALQDSLSRDDGKGFTYFGWYGDWKGCNLHNAPDQQTVPILTTCATMACNYSFPSPAYMTIVNAQPDMTHWLSVFDEFEEKHPWENKITQVYWRGALTENDPKRVYSSARWRLSKLVHEISDESTKQMFDVGFTGFPIFLTAQMDIDETQVGGFKQGMDSMNDFQKYKAILDMDGNSWSSRFSTMLCYNSLAIKVEPDYADHFFVDLVPWKHYVPVKADLSDLIDNVKFVLDPANDGIVRNMIGAANEFCMQRLTKRALALDQLDVWNAYVDRLDGPSTVPGPDNTDFGNAMVRLPSS